MATYTHFESRIRPPVAGLEQWGRLCGEFQPHRDNQPRWNGDVAARNFTVVGGVVAGGTITTMLHTNNTGTVTYEQITGTSAGAVAFLTAPNGDAKLALVLSGIDTLNGYSGDDHLNGYTGFDTMTGGAGNDFYYVDNTRDTVIEAPMRVGYGLHHVDRLRAPAERRNSRIHQCKPALRHRQ